MSVMEMGLYTVLWDDIMGHNTSEPLQNPRLDVNTAASALTSLISFIGTKWDSFEEYEVKAAELANCTEYESEAQCQHKINVHLAYKLVDTHFGFLNKLDNLTNEEIITAAQNLVETCHSESDDQSGHELIQFTAFHHKFQEDDEKNMKMSLVRRGRCINSSYKKVKVCFLNINVTLRMYLSLMVANSSGERSFSK
ncbi:hypothetical protein PR048_020840 [Dryococelus australis]|uniref:Uncharacterized protein n=1 Tax=Dryococelus australis TaxID=614101 RepID=A0ABQ9GWJ8_9NEOP|nr:hypothetical protein PR048_020840 [Dryococelus australis]